MSHHDDEDLPGHLYQPVRTKNAPTLVTGFGAQARRRARELGITVHEAMADFPAAQNLTPYEWVEIDGRRVAVPRRKP